MINWVADSRYSTDEDWLVPHFEKCFMTMPN
jgi:uncharacterized protein YyaL (SSP411 family)